MPGKESIEIFLSSQTSENLMLVGYGCSDSKCDWELNKRIELWEALKEFRPHVIDKHPKGHFEVTYLYKRMGTNKSRYG